MARHLSATLVVALVLLRCCAGTIPRKPIFIQQGRQSPKGWKNDPQQLKGVQVPQQPNTKLPQLPPAPAQNCDVAIGQRVPCGAPDISASACNAISCCFDNNGCFYGKAGGCVQKRDLKQDIILLNAKL